MVQAHRHAPPKIIKHRYDEYGILTSSYDHDWVGLITAAIHENIKGKLRIYFIEFNPRTKLAKFIFYFPQNPRKKFLYKVILSTSKTRLTVGDFQENSLIIDMNQLFYGHNAPLHYLLKPE